MKDNLNKIFARNLQKYLKQQNKNNYQLADYLGVSSQTITNYTKGYNAPRMDKIDKIAEYFNISRDELLFDKTEDDPTPTQFTTTKEAIEFLMNQNIIAANTGINISDYTEYEINQFANRLLDYARFLDNDKKMDR